MCVGMRVHYPLEMARFLWRYCHVLQCLGLDCFQGVEGGGIIGSGFLGGCQRLYWEIGSGCHSGGCWLRTQHECKIFQPCSDGLLYCDGVTPAWYCQWGQRNAPVREGALYTIQPRQQTNTLPSCLLITDIYQRNGIDWVTPPANSAPVLKLASNRVQQYEQNISIQYTDRKYLYHPINWVHISDHCKLDLVSH
jgi:hypothetical protein